MVLQRAYH
jgi:hypothetical protein